MKIGFDAKRYFHNHTGLGNYSRTVVKGLATEFPDDEHVLYDEKSWTRTFRLGHKAETDGCQLFHGLSNELPMDISKRQIPSLVTMHDVAWRTFPDMYHWADRQIYDFKYGRSCQKASRVVAISESTKRDVMRFYNVPEENIDVIYQPVQELFYSPLSPDETDAILQQHFGTTLPKDFILNVGSINSRKNLLGLIKALELIPRDQRPLLLVVGNGREYKQEVLQYASSHGLQDSLRIETNIRDNRVLQVLYSRALLMAYPSHYEGFGLPVVEAALQKCPIITSNVSSLPEAAGPGALLVDPDDISQISQALSSLLDHPDKSQDLAIKAEAYARQCFDPTSLTHQMHDLYLHLI